MNQLILEIDRMREIMGIDVTSKPIILEQVGVLYKIFQSADNALKDVEENKTLIKQLDGLKPKGVAKMSAKEIDDLAQLLSDESDNIARAMAGTGFESALTLKSAKKLNNLIIQTVRRESDALLNLYITKQLTKIYDDATGYWNVSYNRASKTVRDNFIEQADAGILVNEDDIITSFKRELEKELKKADDNFKWSDYPEFENWAMKQFNDLDGTLDNITKERLNSAIKSTDRNSTFKSTKTKTETKLTDIDQLKLTNFRFIQGIKKRFTNWATKTSAFDTFEKNAALLKGFPTDKIFKTVGEKTIVSEEFAALVRNIGFDIEQIATQEKNVLQQWKDLMKEVNDFDPKLSEGMMEVPMYKEVGNGYIWAEEKLSVFMQRLNVKFEGKITEGGGFLGSVLDEIKEIWKIFSFSKESILASTQNVYKGIFGFLKKVRQKLFTTGIYSVPFTPKQIGLMLSRRGYGVIPFAKSFLETWFILHVWHNFIMSIVGVIGVIGTAIADQFYPNLTDDNRTIEEALYEAALFHWVDLTEYLKFPFSPGWMKTLPQTIYKWMHVNTVDQTERELQNDRDSAFNKYWDNLPENAQEKLLEGLEKGDTAFDRFSKVTTKNGPRGIIWYPKFKEKNGLSDDEIEKIRNARVVTVSKEDKLGMPTDKLKEYIKNFNMDDYLKVGGIRDKNGVVYTIKTKGDNFFEYEFTPPDKYVFYGVQPDKFNKVFYVYEDRSDSEPRFLTAEDLQKNGFNNGYDKQGGFESKETAEDVKDKLKENTAFEPQPAISIQELLKRL